MSTASDGVDATISLAVPVRQSDVSLAMSTATHGVDATTSLAVPDREYDVSLVMSAATDGVDYDIASCNSQRI